MKNQISTYTRNADGLTLTDDVFVSDASFGVVFMTAHNADAGCSDGWSTVAIDGVEAMDNLIEALMVARAQLAKSERKWVQA